MKMCEIFFSREMDRNQSDLHHHTEGVFNREVFKGVGNDIKKSRKKIFDTTALN